MEKEAFFWHNAGEKEDMNMFQKLWKTILIVFCLSMLFTAAAFAADASQTEGQWIMTEDKAHWTYRENPEAEPVRNQVLVIGRNTYGFDKNGYMIIGYASIQGKEYYFEKSGTKNPAKSAYGSAVKSSWVKVDTGKYYYFGKDYTRDKTKIGFQKINGNIFYLKASGKVTVGAKTINKKKFYFKSNGVMVIGPKKLNGKIYLYSASGSLGTKGARITSSGWKKVSGKYYYLKKGVAQTGWIRLSGKRYYLKKSTGARLTGWNYVGKYKYYFNSKGQLIQDVSSKLGKQSSYYITVNRRTCVVTIYAKDGNKGYTIPVKAMACSVGKAGSATPKGTFHTMAKYRWKTLMGPTYGQYATRITGSILFHSVSGSRRSIYSVPAKEYNKLGSPASHGCVRLCVRDAKWIYDNCRLKTTVVISDNCAQPFDKPATIKISSSTNYDPTDPAIRR